MPCYDGREEQDRIDAHAKVERLTRVACELAKFASKFKRGFSHETTEWMAEHAALDRQRENEVHRKRVLQSEKECALAKLTLRERRVLGLR